MTNELPKGMGREEWRGETGLVAALIQFEYEVATGIGCHAGHAAP